MIEDVKQKYGNIRYYGTHNDAIKKHGRPVSLSCVMDRFERITPMK